MIKAVIFDIDNTLYSYDNAHARAFPELLLYAKEELGIPEDEFREEYSREFAAVRAMLGETAEAGDRILELRCNLDDMTGEDLG